jgi:hypothetical protein
MIAKDKILDIIEKLETEGIDGVWAKFAAPPHVAAYRSVVGHVVVLWRDGIRIIVELDDGWRIRKARIEYGQD